jgi:hypothetical protein
MIIESNRHTQPVYVYPQQPEYRQEYVYDYTCYCYKEILVRVR